MKQAIDEGRISVPQAKRIVSIVTPGTPAFWISKASHLSQRDLDREVAKELPAQAIMERIQPKYAGRLTLELGISEELEKQIRRVQDLLSQRTRQAVTIETALGFLCREYLKRSDPLEIAKRNGAKQQVTDRQVEDRPPTDRLVSKPVGELARNVNPGAWKLSSTVPRNIQHHVRLATGSRCMAVLPTGKPCGATRWLDFHHIKPRREAGIHSVENLTLLCRLCRARHSATHTTGHITRRIRGVVRSGSRHENLWAA